MMEKYLGMDPGSYSTFKPSVPGKIPPRRTKRIVNAPSTPSNNREPSVCGNCQCLECPGPCLSPLSRPPHCDSCGFRHGPTYTQCSSTHTPTSTTTPNTTLTTDNIGTTFTELSPTHLYAPRAPRTIHLLPPLTPWKQQLPVHARPKPILLTALNLKAIFSLIATTVLPVLMKEMIYVID